jgi:hypothetical protein
VCRRICPAVRCSGLAATNVSRDPATRDLAAQHCKRGAQGLPVCGQA